MPFQDDPAIRPLFDRHEGGSPAAWMCIIPIYIFPCSDKDPHKDCPCGGTKDTKDCAALMPCRKITKSLQGMRTHQEQVHGYTPQMEIGTQKDTVDKVIPESIIGNHGT